MTNPMFRWTEFALSHGARLLVIALVAFLLNRLLRGVTHRLVKVAEQESTARLARIREQHTRTMAGVLYSTGSVVIVLVSVLMALPEFGFNITPVAAAAGLASLAVGFGAQYLVRDFINGFLIVFEDQYIVGDVVRIGDVAGRVEHLTLRRTVVRNETGAVVSIPNGEVGKVANMSRDWSQVFLDTTIESGQPLEEALSALDTVAGQFRADAAWAPMLVDGPRLLGLESLQPGGATLRLLMRTMPNRQDDVARELRRRVQIAMEQRGIKLGTVQRVQILGAVHDATPPAQPAR